MGWEARELGIATGLGATSGGALIVAGDGNAVGSLVGAGVVVGAIFGLVVGAVSVVAGHLAIESTRHWPARSERCWRLRFATSSASGVFLLVSGFWIWIVHESGVAGSGAIGGVAVGFAAIAFLCTLLLAPRSRTRSELEADGTADR
ncbi:membrane associated rhomboid family serine protease [Rhodococcus sp. LBL1]|nr:membrane associated rhomboid family serine protease [Rhodococcus sp. LBL1]MDH6685385.1 membrane associated rhomboid family serine protease [Rhodococcus sp. LBL2]